MFKEIAEAFFDEMEKIAGVGVDIHGYHRKPETKNFWRNRQQAPNPAADVWDDFDEFEYEKASRIKTPYDRPSSRGYKVHGSVLVNSPTALSMQTDKNYTDPDKPLIYNINRKQLKQLRNEYERHRSGEYPEAENAFLSKIDHLLKDKKMRFARLEYE